MSFKLKDKVPFSAVLDPTVTPYVELVLVSVSKLNRAAVTKTVAGDKNKRVKMRLLENGNMFELTTGRAGIKLGPDAEKTLTYPVSEWGNMLSKYESMRYEVLNTTDPGKKKVKIIGEFKEILNKSVREIITKLMKEGEEAIKQELTIDFDNLTDDQLKEAQRILLYMTDNLDKLSISEFNELLIELWKIIPRPMNQINRKMAHSKGQFEDILAREQDFVDTLFQNLRGSDVVSPDKDILEANGIEMRPCTDEEIKEIKELMTTEKGNLVRAWRVINKKTEKEYEAYKKERGFEGSNGETLLFHGSGVGNWWSIIKNGLFLNPELIKPGVRICGKAFGYGIYFAAYCAKSMSYARSTRTYASDGSERYMGVYRVLTGNPYFIYQDPKRKTPHNWTDFHADHPDMDCCWASSGYDGSDIGLMRLNYDETIVYRQDQCTIKYLVEFI